MKWAQEQHSVETAVEWVAPALLAAAAGWAGLKLGVPVAAAAGLVLMAYVAGFAVMRWAGSDHPTAIPSFETLEVEPVSTEWEELLLEPKDELLILDDPLVEPTADSRVVRLFARQEPTPGELVDRIADFLSDGRRPAPAPQHIGADPPIVDASASLHAALANIRASLR